MIPATSYRPEPGISRIDWTAFGPTMDGPQFENVGKFSRSKRLEMMNAAHPRFDSTFPASFSLSDSPSAKRLFWTRDVAAWVEARAERFRQAREKAATPSLRAPSTGRKAGGRA